MKDPEIFDTWSEFINDEKYKEYFISNEDKWKQTLAKVKEFMDENRRRPNKETKNQDEKILGNWIGTQVKTILRKNEL